MNCPRCEATAPEEELREYGGVCAKCLLDFAAENDAPSFPDLEILSLLGEGGMGTVYKARQTRLNRIVALKVLSPTLASDPRFVERFSREAKALGQLSHPNIVDVYDTGVHEKVPYLIMEYVEGTSLRKLLAQGRLSPELSLRIVPQICDALQYAHKHGVIHRDIKPENILVDPKNVVKIADFGLAKLSDTDATRLTRTQMVMGSPHYMAPEQVENPATVDHRADIYSLGVIFYEMLTGELPLGRFKAPSERAEVDRRLDPVVMKSLEKEPQHRYQSAGEIKDRVANLDAAPPRPSRKPRGVDPTRRPAWAPAGCLVVLWVVTLPVAVGVALLAEAMGAPSIVSVPIFFFLIGIIAWIQVVSRATRLSPLAYFAALSLFLSITCLAIAVLIAG